MSPWSADALRNGGAGMADPQFGTLPGYPAFTHVQTVADGETIKLGDLRLTAHFTGGHTPGGTSWSWKSCERSEGHTSVLQSLMRISYAVFCLKKKKLKHTQAVEYTLNTLLT